MRRVDGRCTVASVLLWLDHATRLWHVTVCKFWNFNCV